MILLLQVDKMSSDAIKIWKEVWQELVPSEYTTSTLILLCYCSVVSKILPLVLNCI